MGSFSWIVKAAGGLLFFARRVQGIREEGGKAWDRLITSFAAGLLPLSAWAISGLDVRFGRSRPIGLGLHIDGATFFALGWTLLLWVTASNVHL